MIISSCSAPTQDLAAILQATEGHELDFTMLLSQSRVLGNQLAMSPKQQQREQLPENCTFHPQIRASSHARAPRSVYELSIGDQQRKDAWVYEQQRVAAATDAALHPFKPSVLRAPKQYRAVQSKLSIAHPAFLEHWNRKRDMVTTLAMRKQYEREVRSPPVCVALVS